jgi:crossover junction endodeoxyribonuclease RuvC
MIVLGIDPGYDRCGIAIAYRDKTSGRDVVVWSTCLETNKKDPHHKRHGDVCLAVEAAMDTHKPSVLAIETLFFNKNVSTALKVAEVRGAIMFAATRRGIHITELSPQDVKAAVTGVGNADKQAIASMIPKIVTLPDHQGKRLDDELDAIAVAIAGLSHTRIHHMGLAS